MGDGVKSRELMAFLSGKGHDQGQVLQLHGLQLLQTSCQENLPWSAGAEDSMQLFLAGHGHMNPSTQERGAKQISVSLRPRWDRDTGSNPATR